MVPIRHITNRCKNLYLRIYITSGPLKPYNEPGRPDLNSYGPITYGPMISSLSRRWTSFTQQKKFSEIFEVLKYLDVLTSWELLERVFYE